jgi:Zn-dependent protease with chaperone function
MMHISLVFIAIITAWILRSRWTVTGSYAQRWQQALIHFLVPALLLLMTAIALLCMGPSGQMVMHWEGWLTYDAALGFLAALAGCGLLAIYTGWQSIRQVKVYRQADLFGYDCRILDTSLPYSAQIGLWQPELVVSQGLIDSLEPTHLQAVLAHEMGHYHYRDTFWFFWLGWLRRVTAWLPRTEELWEELLLLREIRADCWAAQRVDQLLLAESLVEVAKAPLVQSNAVTAAFSCRAVGSRMQERIEALLTGAPWQTQANRWSWLWFGWVILPLLTIPFHY